MRALVISGGGSKGAFAGGVAQYLIQEQKRDYNIFIGCSTGSLLVPHLSMGEIDKIKKAYTSVGMKDIYNISPFNIKKQKDGTIKTSINHLNILRMFGRGKKTFGEHKNLRTTIGNFFSEEDFDIIKSRENKILLTVSNFTTKQVEYKYARDCNYKDYCDWMWASCSFVPFMSIVEKNGYEYADGGFGNYIPIQEAINNGATEIDVIVLTPRNRQRAHIKSRNAFDLMLHTIQFMNDQISHDDILIGHLFSIYDPNIKVNFFFTPRVLTEHSFYFDKTQMTEWWDEGFEFAADRCKQLFSRYS